MKPTTFCFVNGIEPDRASKRRMRHHVMKGKNAGKPVNRPSKSKLMRRPAPEAFDAVDVDKASALIKAHPVDLANAIMHPLFTIWHPVKITPYALSVMDEFFKLALNTLFQNPLCSSLAGTKWMWIQSLFVDEACYHCSIGLMQACNEFVSNGKSSPRGLYHLSKTIAQIKKRLAGPDALSDSTLGIVVSLIKQEQIRQEYTGARVHSEGLMTLVKLRGGLSTLDGNLAMLLKICKTDITYSVQYGTPPAYFRDEIPAIRKQLASKGICFDRVTTIPDNKLQKSMNQILADVMNAASLFNEFAYTETFDDMTYLEVLLSTVYRLLRFHSLDYTKEEIDVSATYHIGLMLFMMTSFLRNDSRRLLLTPVLSASFWDILERFKGSEKKEKELYLWFTMIGGVWIAGEGYKASLLPRLQDAGLALGISSWDEAHAVFVKFPWIGVAVHDEPARMLWEEANRVVDC